MDERAMRAVYNIYNDLHDYFRLVNTLKACVVARGVNIEKRFTIYKLWGKSLYANSRTY